jgi:hypothetical protein
MYNTSTIREGKERNEDARERCKGKVKPEILVQRQGRKRKKRKEKKEREVGGNKKKTKRVDCEATK